MAKVHKEARTKVNLFLDIIRKREDGYHDIGTLFQELGLCEPLTLQEIKGDSLELHMLPAIEDLPAEKNLVWRAAQAFRAALGIKKGVRITLEKTLPMGAGLGGGSADAAAVLVGLNELWECGATVSQLKSIASGLGADVAFFIEGGTQWGDGIGDKLAPAIKPSGYDWVAVGTPECFVSTAMAYAGIKPSGSLRYQDYRNRYPGSLPEGFNVFEERVFPLFPQIAGLKKHFAVSGALLSMMSGSGASVFGVFESESEARESLESAPVPLRFSAVTRFR